MGCPVSHSQSPALFLEYFSGRPDILSRYSYDLIDCSRFQDAYAVFLRDYLAVNVTAPFKEDAYRAADSHDRAAVLCRASNLLVKENQGIRAYNTDFEAVREILRLEFQGTEGLNAVVIGCGGAGKAASAAAYDSGMRTIICNRTLSRAEDFASHLRFSGRCAGTVEPECLSRLEKTVADADVVIYTLPEPVEEIVRLLSAYSDIFSGKAIVEASYKSPSLNHVQCRRYVSGQVWLRLQAQATYRIVLGPQI